MAKPYPYWIKILYGPLISLVVFFMDAYKSNRERVSKAISGNKIASFFQTLAIVILVLWALVFFFAGDENRDKLTQEVKQRFGELPSLNRD